MKSDFVPLHLHTEYSLLDGAIKIDELINEAVNYNMPAVAITDHGNLFGALDFYKKASKAGIKPIIGCEVYVAPNSRFDKSKKDIGNGLTDEASFHLILLAKDSYGYKNLSALLTKAYIEGFYYKPRIDKELLEQYSGGLIGLTACLKGEIPYYLGHNAIEKARESALQYKHILGPENFFFELQDNGIPEQKEINKRLVELSEELHIPLVATNDCHYLKKEDAKAHDILLCIQTGKLVKDTNRMRMQTDEFYFKSPDEMIHAFREIPQAILNTRKIAEMCNIDFVLGKTLLPRFEIPNGISPNLYLEELAFSGLKERFKGTPPKEYIERLRLELDVIKKMGYAPYFLIVWDFINYSKRNHIPVGPGRGSAAGSLVAYCLKITEIDPLKYNLLFERFLNPERISMPDIDVDFCKDRRAEVINYVSEKYGSDRVAQIITFGTMAAKAAIRDVGRVLDIPYAEVDKIAKLVPSNSENIDEALKLEPQLKELYENNPTVKELIDIAKRLEGLRRHASTHAAGVVIAPEPLTDFMPLYKNNAENIITTQFDMESIENIGLLKFDFLGLKTLTVIEKTIDYLKLQGKDFNLSEINLEDEDTYKLLSSGETTGIFQLESAGMRDILTKMRPNRFEDLIALVALYRPGPIGSGMIDDFIKRKKGETEVKYDLPQLKEILDETYGVIVYQEQVMRIANKIANFSMGQADILRRAMGKKKPEEMEKQKEAFIRGAVSNGISEHKAEKLFDLMAFFAEYGFNKSHSAAYAYLAYQTAYLKAHYPVEFMAANLSADMGDTDKIVKLINECKNMSISLLPPDINLSDREFKIDGNSIRFGLEAVKGVGESAIEVIVKERENGHFKSFEEFLSRVDKKRVNKKVIESLIKAGAFDSLSHENRMVARPSMINILSNGYSKDRGPKLFDFEDTNKEQSTLYWDEATLLYNEKESLGFYLSGHPMTKYRDLLSAINVIKISDLENQQDRAEVTISGVLNDVKSKAREKNITAYLNLEDETGKCEIIVFSELYKKYSDILKKGNMVLIKGQVLKSENGSKIMAKEIKNLSDIEINKILEISIQYKGLSDIEKIHKIEQFMENSKNGNSKTKVLFNLIMPEYTVIIESKLKPKKDFTAEIERVEGINIKTSYTNNILE
jgi:DNA polymerase-3 subunit alpha